MAKELDFHSPQELGDASLEGDMINSSAPKQVDGRISTLDEPVRQTIMRDLTAVAKKFVHVLYPKTSTSLLKEWDLWGPLFLCITLSILLNNTGTNNSGNDGGPQFAEVFVIFWIGAVIVTLNTKLLGGDISIFQSVCVLGYCVLPLVVALVICKCILLVKVDISSSVHLVLFSIRSIVVIAALVWSIFASTAFIANVHLPGKKALALYPVFLFYFVISWLIISHTKNST